MVTLKLDEEQYEQLQTILQSNKGQGLSGLLQETFFGHAKRVITEKAGFDKKAFEQHLKDKQIRDHNKMMDLIKDTIVIAIEQGLDSCYIPFEINMLSAMQDCSITLEESGMKKESINIIKTSIVDRFKLKVEHPYLMTIKF